ncbi:hypothetical protein M316_0019 [Nitrincola phage 1M3-16]|uniref:hypothetical protein n=1 Tax=Nitrincola phage 1M3-16 TaxID=1472912 RepID=UPI000444CB9F|nr:hypothetical protein GJ22_gp133 [Nitrincola phage 1M3-16]AHX01084.1 hypothetical protein M316_0019 [Nitrincola phage 1M3-16]
MTKRYDPCEVTLRAIKPNPKLLAKMGIPDYKQKTMQDLYSHLTSVLNRPDMFPNPVEQIEALEYAIQILWGFDPDRGKHTYWHRIEGCSCGGSDSDDMFGTGLRWIDSGCKWHGGCNE